MFAKRIPFYLSLTAILWSAPIKTGQVHAHGPHDVIEVLAISPAYDKDKTLFVVEPAYELMRSSDGGFSWKQLTRGLDNRTAITCVVLSPSYVSKQTVFLATSGDGIYQSTDGGDSWKPSNHGLDCPDIVQLMISPAYETDQVVLAGDRQGRIYKTHDAGQSWRPVMDGDAAVGDAVFFAESDKNMVLLGDTKGVLHLSENNGDTWRQISEIPEGYPITSIALSANGPGGSTFFIGTDGGLYKSTDGGLTFVSANDGITDRSIRSVALSPSYQLDNTIFVSSWHDGAFRSTDGGRSWQAHLSGLTKDVQADSAAYKSPHFRQVCISNAFAEDGTLFLAGFDGLFKTTDGAQTWCQVDTQPPSLIMALAVPTKAEDSSHLGLVTACGGVYLSADRGATWQNKNKGLKGVRFGMNVAFSPVYGSDHSLFLLTETIIARSTDRGETWDISHFAKNNSRVANLLRSVFRKTGLPIPTMIKYRPLIADHVAFSPDYALDRTVYFGTRREGIYQSTNAGNTWSCLVERREISSLVISPNFPADETLFVGTRGEGVWVSLDKGKTWKPANNGFGFLKQDVTPDGESFAVDITRKDVQLATSPGFDRDQTLAAGSSNGLFLTTDAGKSWRKVPVAATAENEVVKCLAFSPNFMEDKTLLVSLKGRGLFASNDGGVTFTTLGSQLIENNYILKEIEFSPSYAADRTIYGASDEQIFRSADGGHTWSLISRPFRYENMRDDVVFYEGDWRKSTGVDLSGYDESFSDSAGSKASLTFVGTSVAWIGTVSPDHGIANVYLNGALITQVSQYSSSRKTCVPLYEMTKLPYGVHTISVEATGRRDENAAGNRLSIDAFAISGMDPSQAKL